MASPATSRPTVVLLHASASSARQWQGLIGLLQPRFRCHAIELHGHGAQADWRGDAPLALADDAALVEPVLAEAGAVHLVGHSYGAAVAFKLASLHPGSVRSLVAYEPVLFRLLIDAPACTRPARALVATFDFIRERLAHGDTAAAAARFVDLWSGSGAWAALSAGGQAAVAARMPSVMCQGDALLREPSPRAELARLGLPTLLLTGARTVASARLIGELLHAALPHARREVLPELGHMGPITHAATVNQRIASFLDAAVAPEPARHAPKTASSPAGVDTVPA